MSTLGKTLSSAKGTIDASGLINVPADQALAISVDTLVEGIHFPRNTSARDLGHKLLAVNLSDLAAMGAKPIWATLSLTLPDDDSAWLDAFGEGFLDLARRFGVSLLTVEKTRGPMSLTSEVGGSVPPAQALRRDSAHAGELIYVTGRLGDAGTALRAMQGQLSLPAEVFHALSVRLNRPEPRIREGRALRGLASSAIDISDGLASDLGHILERSNIGAELDLANLPVSPQVVDTIGQEAARQAALTAGDDYELCFTLPPERRERLAQAWKDMECPITLVGRTVVQSGLTGRLADGSQVSIGRGYEHFT